MSGECERVDTERDEKAKASQSGAVQQTESGASRVHAGNLMPLVVVAAGVYLLLSGMQASTLRAAALKPVNWAGLVLALVAAVSALLAHKPLVKLAGVLLCGIGAILVICL